MLAVLFREAFEISGRTINAHQVLLNLLAIT